VTPFDGYGRPVYEHALRGLQIAGSDLIRDEWVLPRRLALVPVTSREGKSIFDTACDQIHYAGACHRVGRRMRLAVVSRGRWVGGIVLGSTFPNIRPRDDAFRLTRWVVDWQERGLVSPWASENDQYWRRLQQVVNQARAFVFPAEAGSGLGVRSHLLLETEGLHYWQAKYERAAGFDTLCNHPTSRLFTSNGWTLVGRTLGHSRDPYSALSRRVTDRTLVVRDNAGLTARPLGERWWVWVRVLRPTRLSQRLVA
jgi:hypothetical protein